jgi:hypothetical protein
MIGAPRINEPIVVRDPDGRSYRSRVQGIEPDEFTIAQPLDLPAEHPCEVGSEMLVTWVSPRGVAVVPAQLVHTYAQGLVRLWVVAITGSGWHEQRRDYVRVPVGGVVALQAGKADGPIPVTQGQIADVSEAALRCSVETAEADALLTHEGDVTAGFSIADHRFDLPGRIHTRRPDPRSGLRTELVVLFAQPVPDADTLRRLVFAQQLVQNSVGSNK